MDKVLSFEDSPKLKHKLLLNKAECFNFLRKKEDLLKSLDQAIKECPDDDIAEEVKKNQRRLFKEV